MDGEGINDATNTTSGDLRQDPDISGENDQSSIDAHAAMAQETEFLDTIGIAHRIKMELRRHKISQSTFAMHVLGRSQGTLSDLLRNPKPWPEMKAGKSTFIKMAQWLAEDESVRIHKMRDYIAMENQRMISHHQHHHDNMGNILARNPVPSQVHSVSPSTPQSVPGVQTGKNKKKRIVFSELQKKALKAIFKEFQRPNNEMKNTIAQQLSLDPATVSNFFQNARRRQGLVRGKIQGGSSMVGSSTSVTNTLNQAAEDALMDSSSGLSPVVGAGGRLSNENMTPPANYHSFHHHSGPHNHHQISSTPHQSHLQLHGHHNLPTRLIAKPLMSQSYGGHQVHHTLVAPASTSSTPIRMVSLNDLRKDVPQMGTSVGNSGGGGGSQLLSTVCGTPVTLKAATNMNPGGSTRFIPVSVIPHGGASHVMAGQQPVSIIRPSGTRTTVLTPATVGTITMTPAAVQRNVNMAPPNESNDEQNNHGDGNDLGDMPRSGGPQLSVKREQIKEDGDSKLANALKTEANNEIN